MAAITLEQISALAQKLLDEQRELEEMENAVKTKKAFITVLSEESIPAAMQELGLQTFTLSSGEKVDVKPDVYAAIPSASKIAAFDWLEAHGFGGLIKTNVDLSFGKEELDQATALYKELLERGLQPEFSRDVHAQTLKAFLREQLAAAADIPLELFGARPVNVTKITKPKLKKGS